MSRPGSISSPSFKAAYDVFDIALPKGNPQGITTLKDLEGKTVLLGDQGWSAIVDPMVVQAGGDHTKVKYSASGSTWGQTLAAGQGDAALSWEGLRAQWKAGGLDFDYILGKDWSKFPANSFQIRRSDFEDPALTDLYTNYLKGWAMGLGWVPSIAAATRSRWKCPKSPARSTIRSRTKRRRRVDVGIRHRLPR